MENIKQSIKNMIPSELKYRIKNHLNSLRNQQMLRKYKTILPYEKKAYPAGINLIGDIQAETGLGQSMRILAGILEKSRIPFVILQVDQLGQLVHDIHTWDHKISEKAVYQTNLIHINTSDWAECYMKLPKEVLDKRYNIAYWLWELEEFPKKWVPCMDTVDEIWAPSEFICQAIRKCTEKPVRHIPYEIALTTPVKYGRSHFGLDQDVFYCLCMYDFKSVSERKNPRGMIQAFKQAFTEQEANEKKIGFIIKVNHADKKEELESLQNELKDYQYIKYVTGNLTRDEVESLIAVSDVYMSLHRSEGFGLPAAEAMFLGTAVVATNWSATTEFMDAQSACLVDYRMVTTDKQIGPYPKGSAWADADVKQAAGYLRRLFEDEAYRATIEQNGFKKIENILNGEKIGRVISENLER